MKKKLFRICLVLPVTALVLVLFLFLGREKAEKVITAMVKGPLE